MDRHRGVGIHRRRNIVLVVVGSFSGEDVALALDGERANRRRRGILRLVVHRELG